MNETFITYGLARGRIIFTTCKLVLLSKIENYYELFPKDRCSRGGKQRLVLFSDGHKIV
jgi:hypothetical protein